MSIALARDGVSLSLHPDLYWSDELAWQAVEQTATRTVTGAIVLSTAVRTAGRPITLEPIDDASAWMSRTLAEQLLGWANEPGLVLGLTLRGAVRSVVFRHHDGAGLDAKPVTHFADAASDDWYRCTLRFMEV